MFTWLRLRGWRKKKWLKWFQNEELWKMRGGRLKGYHSSHCNPQREVWLDLGPDVQKIQQWASMWKEVWHPEQSTRCYTNLSPNKQLHLFLFNCLLNWKDNYFTAIYMHDILRKKKEKKSYMQRIAKPILFYVLYL